MLHRLWVLVMVGVWLGTGGCATDSPRPPSPGGARGRDGAALEAALDAGNDAERLEAGPSSDAPPPTDGRTQERDASDARADAASQTDASTTAHDAETGEVDAAVIGDAGPDVPVADDQAGTVGASPDAEKPPTCPAELRNGDADDETDPLSMLDAFVCDAWTLCCEESCHGTGALDSCLSTRETHNRQLRTQIENGRVLVDPARVRGCVDDQRAASVSCLPALRAVGQVESPTGCPGAFVGTVPTGDACLDDRECAPAEATRSLCVQGSCFPAAPGQEGDPCYVTLGFNGTWWSNDDHAKGPAACSFEDGLHCHPTEGLCAPTLAEGAPCAVDLECGGALCLGTCLAPKPAGAACDPALDTCEQGTCTDGFCTPFGRNDCEGTL